MYGNMNWKKEKLIRQLLEIQPCNAQTLAERLQVSVRSIKNYVREINEESENTILSSHSGYQINVEKAKELLDTQDNHIPQTSKERVSYILNQLLHHQNDTFLNTYDMCDELYISMSTLKNEIKKVKRKLLKYDLELLTHGDDIALHGLEKNKRKMLSSLLYEESNINFVNLDSLQEVFIDIDISFIKQTVLQIFDQYHYFINDYSLVNLVLHITIAIDRIRNQNVNSKDEIETSVSSLPEYALAQHIASRLEEHFQILYKEAEIYEMTLLILSRATTIDYKSINISNLEDFIGKDCLTLVNQMVQEVSTCYYIDLNEPEFLIRFALHIRNLLIRSRNNYFSKNPLTQNIRTSCPMIYDVAVSMAQLIKEHTSISINDDEIAYIAFHLGSTIEAQKNLTTMVTATLYCPSYYDMNLRITDKINQYFSQDILITNILTDESDFAKVKEADMIITTMALERIYTTPIIQIHPFFIEKDQQLVKDKLLEIRKQKKKREFETYIRKLIVPELYTCNTTIKEQSKCIDTMVKKLVKYGYVDSSFKEEILEREHMSSTAYGWIAIPHAMKMHAHKTGIHIMMSETPIDWDGSAVYLVLMMCFHQHERYIFHEIFEPITMILSENEHMKRILSCRTYEEFIQTIVSLL